MSKYKMKFKEYKAKNAIVVNKLNYDTLNRITSHSFYSWHELYYIHANRYYTCLQLFDYPEESKIDFLSAFTTDKDIFVTIDAEHMSKLDFSTNFERIIKHNDEAIDDTKSLRTTKEKVREIKEINTFDHYLTKTNEEVKLITVRLYVSALTLEKLQNKIDEVITKLISRKMKAYIQTNDLESDVKSLTDISNPVKKMVASSTLADILLKSEISKVDEYGSLIGYTANGLYCPDLYSFRNNSYNYILIGGMGAGKSAFLKALEEGYSCLGNHTFHAFDIHGEYNEYAQKQQIPIVSIDDRNTVNVCQMFYTLNDDGMITNTDITSKIAVLVETFKTSANEDRKNVLDHFERECIRYFEDCVLGKNIHDLSNEDWFVLSDIQKRIDEKWKKGIYENEAKKDIYNLRLSFGNMLKKYGFIYNQKTNMAFDLTKSFIFDISFFDKVQDNKIKSAYVSLLIDYVSMAVRLNLEKNNAKMKEMGVYPYQLQRPYYTYGLRVDELLEYAEDTGFLLKLINLLKYMRKAYAGLGVVIHTYDETRKKVSAGVNEQSYLGQIFSLCTNKFVGMTDGASLNDLPNIVKGMNATDVEIVSTFKKGQHGERKFLVIDDQREKYYITSIVNNFQKQYFGGGA
ncbi:MAG: helicase HerA domain-containing protein [Coprobacillus cateniformis]|uniref:helicase HerA domain-containing protein n=1 Tax=Coprobacillus cateniformis TaxID=100884 RepID=UPI0024A82899|nr:DUF87 domain-containing protein [Coprobacillus cateniformis]